MSKITANNSSLVFNGKSLATVEELNAETTKVSDALASEVASRHAGQTGIYDAIASGATDITAAIVAEKVRAMQAEAINSAYFGLYFRARLRDLIASSFLFNFA